MNNDKLSKIGRLLLFLGVLALGVFIIWQAFGDIMPQLIRLLKAGNEDEIERFLLEEGSWKAVAAVIVLAMLQVASIVFPGFAIQIAAGIIYGWWRAFLMCYTGFVLGNAVVFLVARRLGSHINGLVQINKGDDKWGIRERMKSTRPAFVVDVVNLLPVMPNGIIPYIASTTPIRFRSYCLAIMVSCWVQILFNCIAGHFLIQGQYLFMVLAIGAQIAILVFVTVKRKFIMSLMPGGSRSITRKR